MRRYFLRNLIRLGKYRTAVFLFTVDYRHHFIGIHVNERFTDPVTCTVNRNWHPVRGILWDIDVMDPFQGNWL